MARWTSRRLAYGEQAVAGVKCELRASGLKRLGCGLLGLCHSLSLPEADDLILHKSICLGVSDIGA